MIQSDIKINFLVLLVISTCLVRAESAVKYKDGEIVIYLTLKGSLKLSLITSINNFYFADIQLRTLSDQNCIGNPLLI